MHQYTDYIQPELETLIKVIRYKRHLTQEEMAECLRISPRSYSDLERGKSRFSGPSLLFFLLSLTDEEVLSVLSSLRSRINAIDNV